MKWVITQPYRLKVCSVRCMWDGGLLHRQCIKTPAFSTSSFQSQQTDTRCSGCCSSWIHTATGGHLLTSCDVGPRLNLDDLTASDHVGRLPWPCPRSRSSLGGNGRRDAMGNCVACSSGFIKLAAGCLFLLLRPSLSFTPYFTVSSARSRAPCLHIYFQTWF